jgi:hypothetical protein
VRPRILRSGLFDLVAGLAVAAGTSIATTPTYQVTEIPPPPGWTFAQGESINDLGQVTGLASNGAGASQAFIGTAAGSVIIPLPPGWRDAMGNPPVRSSRAVMERRPAKLEGPKIGRPPCKSIGNRRQLDAGIDGA